MIETLKKLEKSYKDCDINILKNRWESSLIRNGTKDSKYIEEYCKFCHQIQLLTFGYNPTGNIFDDNSIKFGLNIKILNTLVLNNIKFNIFPSNGLNRIHKINNIINNDNLTFLQYIYKQFKSYEFTIEHEYFDEALIYDLHIKNTIYDLIHEKLSKMILEKIGDKLFIPYNLIQSIKVSSYTDPIIISIKSRFAII